MEGEATDGVVAVKGEISTIQTPEAGALGSGNT